MTQAQKQPAREVCGLIGRDPLRGDSRCYPVSNSADDPAHLFTLDAAEQIGAMRLMRERGEELFAIYHSHPSSAALPSPTDRRLAEYPGVMYLIISLGTTGVLEMRGFSVGKPPGAAGDQQQMVEIPLEIE